MKIHITNQYGFIKEKKISELQNIFAKAAHELGFYEMGIFVYDTHSDNEEEMSRRLDGIIASVQYDDIVIVQLPTGNGEEFEKKLFEKIAIYSGRKPLVLWQSYSYFSIYQKKYEQIISGDKIFENGSNLLQLENKKVLIDLILDNISNEEKDNECVDIDDDTIHISFGLHDKDGNYSVWVGTAMQSIIEHTDAKIIFHILHDDTLSDVNKRKLKLVALRSGNNIVFHRFDVNVFGKINENMGRFTIGTMFRIMLPSILQDVHKIIYLDADIFVNRDIKELWQINIEDYCLAAVPDGPTVKQLGIPYAVANNQVKRENYFNAGVLYINLDNIRKKGDIFILIMDYLKDNPDTYLPDQDALNVIYSDSTLLISESWNYFIDEVRKKENPKLEKKIYHYAATFLVLYFKNDVDIEYYNTILRTPWREQEGNIQLRRSLTKMNDRIEQLELLLEKITRKNMRVIFYGDSLSMSSVMKLLNVNKNDCEFYDTLDESEIIKSDDVVYIVSAEADFNTGIQKLEKCGLKNGKDFFATQRLVGTFEGGFIF